MELEMENIIGSIEFIKKKIKSSRSKKEKENYLKCLYFLERHKIVYLDNRENEDLLLFSKRMYKVSLTKTHADGIYGVRFRHPMVADYTKRSGRQSCGSLMTTDEYEADRLLEEMKELVHNDYWWDINKKEEALQHFSKIVVKIFYGKVERILEKKNNITG